MISKCRKYDIKRWDFFLIICEQKRGKFGGENLVFRNAHSKAVICVR